VLRNIRFPSRFNSFLELTFLDKAVETASLRLLRQSLGLKPSVNETRLLLNYVERGRGSLGDIRKLQRFFGFAFGLPEMTERQK
jgi:hypothetical protein